VYPYLTNKPFFTAAKVTVMSLILIFRIISPSFRQNALYQTFAGELKSYKMAENLNHLPAFPN